MKQFPIWHRYRVELYPHAPGLGIGDGIRDKYGHELEFPRRFAGARTASRGVQLEEGIESYERLKRGEFDEIENLGGLAHLTYRSL